MLILNNDQIDLVSGGVTMEVQQGACTILIPTAETEFFYRDMGSRGFPFFKFENGIIVTPTNTFAGTNATLGSISISRENTVDGTLLHLSRG